MKKLLLILCSALVLMSASQKRPTIFIIGDSTAANKDIKKGPERGWGMALQGFFTENIRVDNHALNGRSSRSFIIEGHWQKVLDAMKPGDYLIIQFGHNDEKGKIGDKRHTDAGLTFDDNYRMYARAAQAKGATPIIMNCVVRRNFYRQTDLSVDDESLRTPVNAGPVANSNAEKVNSDTRIDTHGYYAQTPEHVAKMLGVPYIDANKITKDLENGLGVEKSRQLHMISVTGKDNTHYTVYGAHVVAGLLADEIAKVCPELKPYVRHYDYVVSEKGFGNYLTLQDAVDAVPAGKAATICVLDGKWKKPKTAGKTIRFAKFSTASIR